MLVCVWQMGSLISKAEEKRGSQFLHAIPSGLASRNDDDSPEAKAGLPLKDLTSDQLHLIFQFALKVCKYLRVQALWICWSSGPWSIIRRQNHMNHAALCWRLLDCIVKPLL